MTAGGLLGSTSSSLCEHWISRLMGSRPPSQASSGSSRRTSLASLSESAEFAGERSEDDGLSSRPAVRGMQRQSFSSRTSIASPLVLSENGQKPSWCSAKLQLRSNSPSRFSLESHSSSPTLEMIGEVVDTHLSASRFGDSPKLGGKSALAALDRNAGAKRLFEQLHPKATSQAELRSSSQAGDNNNLVSGAEQFAPRHGTAAKEQKQRNVAADGAGAKRSSAKTGAESERSPRKRPAASSTSSSSLSPASPAVVKSPARAPAKGAASHPRDKTDAAPKASKAASSRTATPSKRGPSQTRDEFHPDSAQQRRSASPGSAHPQRRTAAKGGGDKSSASAKTKGADRSAGRDSSRAGAVSEKKVPNGGPPSRSGAGGKAEGRPVRASENRTVARSSSSSSSVTSLRSSAVGAASAALSSKGPRRNSKTEDKALSFFKTALRPKGPPKSTDGGKATASDPKASPEDAGGDAARDGSGKKAQMAASDATAAKDKESSKASATAKHLPPPAAKSKLSETSEQASSAREPSKKEAARKAAPSRKIPINSTQSSQRSK